MTFHLSAGNKHDAPEGRKLISSIYSEDSHYLLMDRAYEEDKTRELAVKQELTPELLRLFIQKIVAHEKEVKWSKHAPQTVEIHYADIGCMENRQTAKPEQHKEIPMVS